MIQPSNNLVPVQPPKNPSQIRFFIREFFLYGGIEDDQLHCKDRRIKDILEYVMQEYANDLVSKKVKTMKKTKKVWVLQNDLFSAEDNFLSHAFYKKKITSLDAASILVVLSLLRFGKMDIKELNAFENWYGVPVDKDGKPYLETDDEKLHHSVTHETRSNHIKKLALLGIIKKNSGGVFSLTPDPIDSFCKDDTDRKQRLWDFVTFAKDFLTPSMPGYYVQQHIETTVCEHGPKLITQHPIRFRARLATPLLDDDIYLDLLEIIKNKQYVEIQLYSDEIRKKLLPLHIITERLFGRTYVMGYDRIKERFSFYRLDSIKSVHQLREKSDKYEDYKQESDKYLKFVWTARTYSLQQDNNIEVLFRFDDSSLNPKERFLADTRVQKRLKTKVDTCTSDAYTLLISKNEYEEMKPFLRSFGKCVQIENPEIRQMMSDDWKEVLQLYETYE